MLLVKAEPTQWKKDTLLMHFVERSGASVVFVVTENAMTAFRNCEMHRIYDMEVPGKCVRHCNGVEKYAVKTQFEVVFKYPCPVRLSTTAWPVHFPFDFASWTAFNQISDKTPLDILGKVLETPVRDVSSSLKKLIVLLGNGTLLQPVEFLGNHADLTIGKDDMVAISGLRVREWNRQRTMQTSYLSVIEVNPRLSPQQENAFEDMQDEPKRKAIRLTLPEIMTVAEAKQLTEQMLHAAQSSQPTEAAEFSLRGKLSPFTQEFFEKDPPIIDTTRGEIMCWKTMMEDASGRLQVQVWDKACYELLSLTVTKLRTLWEEGHEDTAKQPTILDTLNKALADDVTCLCRADTWSYGKKDLKHAVQVKVNLCQTGQ